ncbi:hypothetical protein [Rummeliibacillus sp. TYF-LIM-RU47]|uniref:hypothetical protein n=1 Tax=Rummeliibacillus sp. TYF-LIM-RU47 TaxID=2608406 RepID=UPI0016815D53|nr:hypothetical protein [Rummeliibacillus sp. TYF-LIM-RU47]
MSTKQRSQLYQGLALPAEAIMPATPYKVATPNLIVILSMYFHFALYIPKELTLNTGGK